MKRVYHIVLLLMLPAMMLGQGWPSGYSGVMLQGFYWDSYTDTRWTNLESQADELAEFFKLVLCRRVATAVATTRWAMTHCTGLPTTPAPSAPKRNCNR